MKLRNWRAVSRNSLLGFAEIELSNGLIILDISVHQNSGRYWAAMPAVPQLENGKHKIVDGKGQWKRVIYWNSRELSDKFSQAVVALIKQKHPEIFGRAAA